MLKNGLLSILFIHFFLICCGHCADPLYTVTSGELAGAIVGSILCTLVFTCAGFFAFYWFYMRKRDAKLDFEDAARPGYRINLPLVNGNRHLYQEKGSHIKGTKIQTNIQNRPTTNNSSYVNAAYSDPDEKQIFVQQRLHQKKYNRAENEERLTSTHDEHSSSAVRRSTAGVQTQTASHHHAGPLYAVAGKNRSALRHGSPSQKERLIYNKGKNRVNIRLRGHDFTGLGFNICGNMRDGIYVQNVLQRGPAAESGLLEPGDRIVDVQVSFKNIVFEDALTILSYASPYDVTLSVKKQDVPDSETSSNSSRRSSSLQARYMPRSSPLSFDKVFFPLKRSQSIGDLDMISKKDVPYSNSSASRSSNGSSEDNKRKRAKSSPDGRSSAKNNLQSSSPASSIRHVLTKPAYTTTKEIWHSRESSISKDLNRQDTTNNGVTEETITFSRIDSVPKKKPAPPPPPSTIPNVTKTMVQSSHPRPFSSVSESSEDTSTSQRYSEVHPDDARSLGESSMVNEIFRELQYEQDRSMPGTVASRGLPMRPAREYQTFEMVWTEGSESETSSVLDKISSRRLPSDSYKDSIQKSTHSSARQRSASEIQSHDDQYSRSPRIIQMNTGSRLILPVNMEPTPSISTPTSFESDENASPDHRYAYNKTASVIVTNGDGKSSKGKINSSYSST